MANPYLPSWEYVPDAEPYVFNDRVYVYGSHDRFNGDLYCLNDYVCWSAPVDDLTNWTYEGVIYRAESVEDNDERDSLLYAPDVTVGPDGRYYLYYVDSKRSIVSVAVCDEPSGEYAFYGYVAYEDGIRLGEKAGDEPQFDPGVMTEGERTYLYTGFCARGDGTRSGAMVTVLGEDMLTIIEAPQFIVPNDLNGKGTSFEGHEFFEAPSIRKKGDTYYFIYSSILMHELCYATSKSPTQGFVYGGVLVSNNDAYIDSYKPGNMTTFYGGNNHGSMIEIQGQWYIFYHRHTNGTNFSRQGCMEPIRIQEDGHIDQVEMTSLGGAHNNYGLGVYPSYLACNLFCKEISEYTDFTGAWMGPAYPKITQEGKDGDEVLGYIANMKDGATAGFKYFEAGEAKYIRIRTRGYIDGWFEVRTSLDGPVLAKISVKTSNSWKTTEVPISITEEKCSLYFTYNGRGSASFESFELI